MWEGLAARESQDFGPGSSRQRVLAGLWRLVTQQPNSPSPPQFDTIRLCLIKVAGRVTEMVTRIKIALPTAFPYQVGFTDLAGRIAKLPP